MASHFDRGRRREAVVISIAKVETMRLGIRESLAYACTMGSTTKCQSMGHVKILDRKSVV